MFGTKKKDAPVGHNMLELLSNPEKRLVVGGQRGPVPRPGNPCTNIPRGRPGSCR